MNLDALLNFIHAHLGLNAGHYGQEAWRELLLKRIATVGDHSPEAYLIRLQTDERELHTLTSLITINETYFYREPQHLRLLTEQLCPELLAQRTAAGRPVRILSVGCSTGEEPYSILMALRERYGELAEQLFEINAGDVDREVLDRARAGVYGRFSFRALSQTLQDRYFTPCDANQFQIDARLRQQVQFQPFNLLAPDYPAHLVGQDVIFFRNVSIYFDAPTRQRVQQQLKTLLVPGGYLFVGIAETLANDFGVLTLRERQGVFLFVNAPPPNPQKPEKPTAGFALPAPLGARSTRPAPLRRQPSHRPTPTAPTRSRPPLDADRVLAAALALAQAERYAEALAELAPLSEQAMPPVEALALKAHLLLELERLPAAVDIARQLLERDPWRIEALLLLGRAAHRQGQMTESIEYLRRAVYHQPEAWPAHFQLAEAYSASGQSDLAQREYRIVLRQLERPAAGIAPQVALIGAPALSLGDLRQLCQIRLRRLDPHA